MLHPPKIQPFSITERHHFIGKLMSVNNSQKTYFKATISAFRSESISSKKLIAFLLKLFSIQYLYKVNLVKNTLLIGALIVA